MMFGLGHRGVHTKSAGVRIVGDHNTAEERPRAPRLPPRSRVLRVRPVGQRVPVSWTGSGCDPCRELTACAGGAPGGVLYLLPGEPDAGRGATYHVPPHLVRTGAVPHGGRATHGPAPARVHGAPALRSSGTQAALAGRRLLPL